MSSKEIITNLELIPHPEGAYFCEIYRNNEVISDIENESVIMKTGEKVIEMMKPFPLFAE